LRIALAAQNLELEPIERKTLADFGNRTRLVNNQTCNRGRLFVGQMPIEHAIQIADRRGALDLERSIGLRVDFRLLGVPAFIGNATDDFFDDICQRDDALQRTIFVDHQGEMQAALAKRTNLLFECGRVGHKPRLFHQRKNVPTRKLAAAPRELRNAL